MLHESAIESKPSAIDYQRKKKLYIINNNLTISGMIFLYSSLSYFPFINVRKKGLFIYFLFSSLFFVYFYHSCRVSVFVYNCYCVVFDFANI